MSFEDYRYTFPARGGRLDFIDDSSVAVQLQGPRYIAVAIGQGRVRTLNQSIPMEKRFDYAIAIDRSNAKLDVCILIDEDDPIPELDRIENSPEALAEWSGAVGEVFPGLRPAVIFERPASELIAFFSRFEGLPSFAKLWANIPHPTTVR